MKKVFVLLVAMSLVASASFAATTIVNSKHDLSSGSTTTGPQSTGTTEICVFCHTPHSAGAVGFGPLWNRTTINATQYYTGIDVNAAITLAGVNSSDAPLCLSCHDGVSLAGPTLVNEPNVGTVATGLLDITAGSEAILGTDLRDDHPVGFSYSGTLITADGGLDTITNIQTEVASVTFYNGANNEMWCSTCHDVHNPTNGAFLVTVNSSSQLCLACHLK